MQLEEGAEITMMGWGNVIVESITKDDAGVVSEVKAKLHLEGDFKKVEDDTNIFGGAKSNYQTKMKLTWIAQEDKHREVELIEYDTLINEKYIPKDSTFQDFVNRDTMHIVR